VVFTGLKMVGLPGPDTHARMDQQSGSGFLPGTVLNTQRGGELTEIGILIFFFPPFGHLLTVKKVGTCNAGKMLAKGNFTASLENDAPEANPVFHAIAGTGIRSETALRIGNE
jgi:hypothetical protein